MTEPIAVNRFTLTKELFYEGMRRVSKENYDGFAKKIVLVIAGLWVAFAAVTLIWKQSMSFLLLETAVSALVSAWVLFYLPWDKRRRAYKAIVARCGDDMERTTTFYEDHLTVYAADKDVTVAYETVEKLLKTEHLLILLTEDNTGILIDRNGFCAGSGVAIYAYLPKEE